MQASSTQSCVAADQCTSASGGFAAPLCDATHACSAGDTCFMMGMMRMGAPGICINPDAGFFQMGRDAGGSDATSDSTVVEAGMLDGGTG